MSTIIILLVQIYILTISTQYKALHTFEELFLFSSITLSLKLVFNCLINGMAHDEADKLLSSLDNITVTKTGYDDSTFVEAMIFMLISKDLRNGFTIGGFLPLRRTTLLSVNNYNLKTNLKYVYSSSFDLLSNDRYSVLL